MSVKVKCICGFQDNFKSGVHQCVFHSKMRLRLRRGGCMKGRTSCLLPSCSSFVPNALAQQVAHLCAASKGPLQHKASMHSDAWPFSWSLSSFPYQPRTLENCKTREEGTCKGMRICTAEKRRGILSLISGQRREGIFALKGKLIAHYMLARIKLVPPLFPEEVLGGWHRGWRLHPFEPHVYTPTPSFHPFNDI